jgi:hypothetical protein
MRPLSEFSDIPLQRIQLKTRRPKKPRTAIVSLFVALGLAAIVAIFGSIHSAYKRCRDVADKLASAYQMYSPEIYFRQLEISKRILSSKSIDELKQRIAPPNYMNSIFKDESTAELLLAYISTLDKMDVVERSNYTKDFKIAEAALKKLPQYARLYVVFQGVIPDELQDRDLPNLKQIATLFPQVYLDYLLRPMRTTFEPICNPLNVILMQMRERPIVVRVVQMPFGDIEKIRIEQHDGQIDSWSNSGDQIVHRQPHP